MTRGERLYRAVEEYAALGPHHRTGTLEDRATRDWFATGLRDAGATVEEQSWTFDRYESTWEVWVGGEEVEAIPLFYEGVGTVDTDHPFVASIPAGAAAVAGFEAAAREALARGAEAAVVATETPTGLLMAINRDPAPATGLPTLLVAGARAGDLHTRAVHVRMEARVVPGASANVVGRIGAGPDHERLVLATPISGWFRGAGERGTGIAVCLEVARELAGSVPLLVLGLSGHELHNLGAKKFIEGSSRPPLAVLHFGASVAAGEAGHGGVLHLARGITIRAALGPHQGAAVRDAFHILGKQVLDVPEERHTDPAAWVGEATVWCRWGAPMVSIAGGFPLFHSPEDVPERATTPELLAASFTATLAAARALAT